MLSQRRPSLVSNAVMLEISRDDLHVIGRQSEMVGWPRRLQWPGPGKAGCEPVSLSGMSGEVRPQTNLLPRGQRWGGGRQQVPRHQGSEDVTR